ncbi:uncharacterized protein FYW61_014816 isoform 2-T2 [Anableps anableps]
MSCSGFVFQVNSAEKFICTVSRNGDQTTYTIPDDSRALDVDAVHECDFSWINGTNFTIADNSGHIPPVLNSSINSLITSKCVEGIVIKQQCVSKTTGMIDYTANCVVTCTEKDFSHGEEGGLSKGWIVVIAVTAVLVVLGGLIFLGYKIYRKSYFSHCGGRYLFVKVPNNHPKPAEV